MNNIPMNLVVISHRLPFPPDKGEKIRTYNQLDYFSKKGCQVTLFCTLSSQEELAMVKDYERDSGFTIITTMSTVRKPAMLMGLLKGRALSVSHFYSRHLQKKINDFVRRNQVDAVYCTSSAMAEYIFRGEPELRECDSARRDLIDFMDLDSDKWRQYQEVSSFPTSLIYRYEKAVLSHYEKKIQQRFDECLFISSNETALFKQQLGHEVSNIKVINNGVDLVAFRPPDRPRDLEKITLLFSGVMDYLPNVNAMEWFVEHVWQDLKQVHPDIYLVIAGMNPKQSISDMAKDDRITVTGYVDDMLAYYHTSSVFVAPFQIARGVQNKILQSFACGLPVVTTPLGAEGIDCVNGTHCLFASDPKQFVEQIKKLIEDYSCYESISCNALELVNRQFTWEASNQQLYTLFGVSKAG